MLRFTLKDLFVLMTVAAIGIGGIIGGQSVFYHGGRAALPLALLMFWGGILVLIVGSIWFLIRLFTRR